MLISPRTPEGPRKRSTRLANFVALETKNLLNQERTCAPFFYIFKSKPRDFNSRFPLESCGSGSHTQQRPIALLTMHPYDSLPLYALRYAVQAATARMSSNGKPKRSRKGSRRRPLTDYTGSIPPPRPFRPRSMPMYDFRTDSRSVAGECECACGCCDQE